MLVFVMMVIITLPAPPTNQADTGPDSGTDTAPSIHTREAEVKRLQQKVRMEERLLQNASKAVSSLQGRLQRAQAAAQLEEQENHRVQETREKLQRMRKEVAEAKHKHKEEVVAEAKHESGLLGFLNALPFQGLLAVILGITSVCSILGPDTFVQAFVAVTGIFMGSLLAAGCAGYVMFGATQENPSILDAVADLLGGDASAVGYVLWLSLMAAGTWRWVTGFSVVLCANVEEVSLSHVQQGRAPVAHCTIAEDLPPEHFQERSLRMPLLIPGVGHVPAS